MSHALFYTFTANEFLDYQRSLLNGLPNASWDRLRVGDRILVRGHGGSYPATVTRIPPKCGYIMIRPDEHDEQRLPRRQNEDALRRITPEFESVMWLKHRPIAEQARADGRNVPLRVQYDYPDVFTAMPKSWKASDVDAMLKSWDRLHEYRRTNERQKGPRWIFSEIEEEEGYKRDAIAKWTEYIRKIRAGELEVKPHALARVIARTEEFIDEEQRKLEILEYLHHHAERTLR